MRFPIPGRFKDPKNIKVKLIGFASIVMGCTILSALLLFTDVLSEIENRTWDWRVKSTVEPHSADTSIKIIMIDQSSLEFFSQEESIFWPWPRGIYEAVINYLKKGGARAAAFDILFSEQSSYGVEDDDTFAQSFKGSLPIVSAAALRRSASKPHPSFEQFKSIQESFDKTHFIRSRYLDVSHGSGSPKIFDSITLPIPAVLNASAAIGNVSAEPDSDGIYRHILPGGYIKDVPVLGLPFALFEAGRRDLAPIDIPSLLNKTGRLAVNFHGPARTYPTYRISSIIQSYRQLDKGETPTLSPDTFKDAWVFIGMDAPGLLDLRPTPLSELYPGVEYHATVLDNLLHNNFAVKTTSLIDLLISVLLAASFGFVIIFSTRSRDQLIIIASLLSLFLVGGYFLATKGIWLGMAIPSIASILSITHALLFQYKLEGQQHRFIKGVFKSYVSPEVIDEIVRNPASLALGGAKREITVFFSDLAGFTSLSESIEAEKLVSLLNQYLSAMTKIILKQGGTVDKYEGDAIIAFWNAPLEVPDHALRAVHSAVECQNALSVLRPKFEAEFGAILKMRIGIHTGVANVGNFGSIDRFNYTIIGDAPNLASRLEGVNKVFGTSILFSENTYTGLTAPLPCRKIGEIKVVGRNKSVTVYSPLDDAQALDQFDKARTAFENSNFDEALVLFAALADDPVSKSYIDRIIKMDKNVPFDRVWSLSSK